MGSTRYRSQGPGSSSNISSGNSTFFSHGPDGKVKPQLTTKTQKTKITSQLESFSYTWKLNGGCTVTDWQAIFADKNRVKSWSSLFLHSLYDQCNRVIGMVLWEQISTGFHFCICLRGKSYMNICMRIFVIPFRHGHLNNRQYPEFYFQAETQNCFYHASIQVNHNNSCLLSNAFYKSELSYIIYQVSFNFSLITKQNQRESTLNPHICITQLQPLAKYGQSFFIGIPLLLFFSFSCSHSKGGTIAGPIQNGKMRF